MEQFTPKQKRRLERIAELVELGPLALAKYLFDLEEKIDEEIPEIKNLMARVKNDPGYTPVKGKDYFTNEERQAFIDSIYSRIEIPEPKDGKTPKAGIDYPSKKQFSDYIDSKLAQFKPKDGYTPQKGFDYFTDEDIRLIALDVLSQMPSLDDVKLTQKEVIEMVQREGLDAKYIKNLPKSETIIVEGAEKPGGPWELPVKGDGVTTYVTKDPSGAYVVHVIPGGASYEAPDITLSATPSQVKEKGATVASVDLTAVTTKNTNDITSVEFYRDAVLIYTVPTPDADGGIETYTDTDDVTDDTDFQAKVSDGTQIVNSNTVSYQFVYPFYYGSASPGTTEANIEALTKLVATQSDKTLTFNPVVQVYKFAYPVSYGALDKILDDNGFDITNDWTIYTVSVTGLDGNPVDYYLYQYNNITTQTDFDITFQF